jgi:hypothetical protein
MAATLYCRTFAYSLDVVKYVTANSIVKTDIQWGPTREDPCNQWVLWFWWDPGAHGGQPPPGSVPPKDSSHA